MGDLQRFTNKEFHLHERKESLDDDVNGLIVDLSESFLDIINTSLTFDIHLKGFKYLVDIENDSWVHWYNIKSFPAIQPLSEVVEKTI